MRGQEGEGTCLLRMSLLAEKLFALERGTNYESRNKQIMESRSVTDNNQVLSSDIFFN